MPLSEADEALFQLLANDREARRAMLTHAKRIKPELSIPEVDAAVDLESRIESKLKPLQDENAELKKQLHEKLGSDMLEARRNSVRKAPYYLNDEQIAELEKRMVEDGNQYKSYVEALRYYQYQDQPVHPSSPIGSPFGERHAQTQTWRDMMKGPDGGKFVRNKKFRKDWMNKQWKEQSALIK